MRDAFGVERTDISKSSQPASVKRERLYATALKQSTPEYVTFSDRLTTATTKRKIGAAKTGNQEAVRSLRSAAAGHTGRSYRSEGIADAVARTKAQRKGMRRIEEVKRTKALFRGANVARKALP